MPNDSAAHGVHIGFGVDIVARRPANWLDLCCGSGRALLDAASVLDTRITGVDLVDFFAGPAPATVELVAAPVGTWRPARAYDLITCVHGLHYVGDKLGLLARAASWLTPDGLFVANFDVSSVKAPNVTKALRLAGFHYNARTRRIRLDGHAAVDLPFDYLGADDSAGPNYTGQPAVDSYYTYHG
ncbi:class I SAM-dependent methyltransferase [Actinocrispum wychmicini]|uniref:Methyltransferase family protein n=1 Tax=Actinocrispum wychmicini TaxID=1213861 RepID=A0A4R2J7E6_9PSEU|nr:class I SAM-dependent methyltransferase [Actinocrispum wychmicini]TCO55023.1 methyltransferase family protein [Actinocrispum wychmicini]